MTPILVLGGTGMLGHALWRTCRDRGIDAFATVRNERGPAAVVLDSARTVAGVTVDDPASVARALDETGATVAVNCIGVVKQSATTRDAVTTIRSNSLFPHQLAVACRYRGVRLIQISTDCVFSGRSGGYSEEDVPDPIDLYGRSKLLGELESEEALTIRTSMIGRELERANGLLEWFLGEAGGTVRGFARAVFSGPTTPVLSRALVDVIERHPDLQGLYHVGAEPIDKHQLLCMLRDAFSLEVEIEQDDTVRVDRSLDSSRFRAATGWEPPSWHEMVAELAETAPEYAGLKESLAQR
jgi:dTDP-4-dehydrorhamnose reductase